MTDELRHFDDPEGEEFTDDFQEAPEMQDEVGASPLDPSDIAGKTSRKGHFLLAIGLAVLVVLVLLARGKSDGSNGMVTADSGGTVADPPATSRGGQHDLLSQLPGDDEAYRGRNNEALIDAPTADADDLGSDLFADVDLSQPSPSEADDLFGPAPTQGPSIEDLLAGRVPPPGTEPRPEGVPTTPQGRPAGSPSLPVVPGNGSGVTAPAAPASSRPAGAISEDDFLAVDARRQAAFEQELRRQAEREAMEERKKAERERLRKSGTQMATSGQTDASAAGPNSALTSAYRQQLVEAYGPEEAARIMAMAEMLDAQSAADAPGSAGPRPFGTSADAVTPGLRVAAVTTSEFIADQEGSGTVEARLVAPLRDRGEVILPAGTRAFGRAQATNYQVGNDARVSIEFTTFVTPDGRVIRDQIKASAADPITLARSVAAKVDHQMAGRVLRGGAATMIDFALTANSQQRSVFDAPTPRDEAITDARKRLSNMLGATVGDERSQRPRVFLPIETSVTLIFGLPTR
jgi:hypothetical protein